MTNLSFKKISLKSESYPARLREISSPPEVLYLAGEISPVDQKAVAVVGSRKMSDYGKKLAWEFSFALAKSRVTVISGLARGIDTIAHRAALFAGGRTVAVLGSGLDVIYPPENASLAKAIVQNGAVLTEFSPGTLPYAKNFLLRNRIISGLSLAVLVIEGARKSGTISTSAHAASLGREVFVVPGSEATDWLAGEGATPVQSPEEIIDYLAKLDLE